MKNALQSFLLLCSIWVALTLGIGTAHGAKPSPAEGTLAGKVVAASTSTAIEGATITAQGAPGTFTTTTDRRGSFAMLLPPGEYSVTASAAGYASQTFQASLRAGIKTTLNFTLASEVAANGTITGTVTEAGSALPLAGATVATDHGGYTAVTDGSGAYTMAEVAAGPYQVTASAEGYDPATRSTTVESELTTVLDFALAAQATDLNIVSLTATPDSFVEAGTASIILTAVIEGTPASYLWSQTEGPKVPLGASSATSAVVDVSTLAVAAEADLTITLTLTAADGTTASRSATVSVQPADMFPVLGADAQMGGSSTAAAKFLVNGVEWCLFNLGTALKATPIMATGGGPVYKIVLPGNIYEVEVVSYGGRTYALVANGDAGISVVDITDPALMTLVSTTPVNYYMDDITFTETGGSILYGNVKESHAAPVVSLETDGTSLYIGDNGFGIHKTALANLFNQLLESDGTLLIEQEVCTVQYAGEQPWGGPITIRLYGGKIFAAMGVLGLGIFDPVTLEQTGRYNLYTDEPRSEDYFGAMAVTQAVASAPLTGEPYLDAFTGMPDYRQVNYEITVVMKGTGTGEPTPWADLEREGKWYYEALDVDIAQQGSRTIAYIAYSLGGVLAVDVTGFEAATAANFLETPYLGFFPAVPVNGPYETGSQPSSLLPYEGAGMLKESGITGVRVRGEQVFLTDHFAGLVILDGAAAPDLDWQGPMPPYNNDTDGTPGNNVPDYEDITSYDMSPWDPADNESLPKCFYEPPSRLATRELKGHGYTLELMDTMDLYGAGSVDVLECSGAGGFVFVDVTDLNAASMLDRFAILVYFPTTAEVGAAADGSATQTIAIGHAAGVDASDNYLYVSDGPHGVSAWQITDAAGFPTDAVHLVANTLQSEYPVLMGTETIYPASHTVRNVLDLARGKTWALCVGNGLRRVPVDQVEAGLGQVGAPLLLKLYQTDSFEHNADWGALRDFPYQDQAYDVEFVGNYAFVADGSNGLTIYDVTKDPTRKNSGYFVGNIGYAQSEPLLGTASGVELWTDPATGNRYAVLASGPSGVAVVNVTDLNNLRIVKVFEPIKYENGDLGVADGQAIDVEVIGNYAYFTYDSFGVLCYALSDLIAPLPDGVDPTDLFRKEADGTVVYDYRPAAIGRFKLQYVPGYETVAGGAVKMDYTEQRGNLMLYVAFHEAGVVKINYTDPANPLLVNVYDTAAEATDVVIANGRLYVADGTGGLVFLK